MNSSSLMKAEGLCLWSRRDPLPNLQAAWHWGIVGVCKASWGYLLVEQMINIYNLGMGSYIAHATVV